MDIQTNLWEKLSPRDFRLMISFTSSAPPKKKRQFLEANAYNYMAEEDGHN